MKSYITIGRSSHCDIIVPDAGVSREHARIYVSGNSYVIENLGKNGTLVNRQVLTGGRVAVAPGADVLLAGRIPLPWSQIYALLPLQGASPYNAQTNYQGVAQPVYASENPNRSIEVWWAILAFIIPIVGWIMYFIWKDETPKRASQAAGIAWFAFCLNLVIILASR